MPLEIYQGPFFDKISLSLFDDLDTMNCNCNARRQLMKTARRPSSESLPNYAMMLKVYCVKEKASPALWSRPCDQASIPGGRRKSLLHVDSLLVMKLIEQVSILQQRPFWLK